MVKASWRKLSMRTICSFALLLCLTSAWNLVRTSFTIMHQVPHNFKILIALLLTFACCRLLSDSYNYYSVYHVTLSKKSPNLPFLSSGRSSLKHTIIFSRSNLLFTTRSITLHRQLVKAMERQLLGLSGSLSGFRKRMMAAFLYAGGTLCLLLKNFIMKITLCMILMNKTKIS